MFPKPKRKKAEKERKKRAGRAAYLNSRAAYLLALARQQGRLEITDVQFERMLITPRHALQGLDSHQYPLCEIQLSETKCDTKLRQARDIHHKRGRAGDDLIEHNNFVGCCRACHDYIERNRKFAISEGWSELRNTTEEQHV